MRLQHLQRMLRVSMQQCAILHRLQILATSNFGAALAPRMSCMHTPATAVHGSRLGARPPERHPMAGMPGSLRGQPGLQSRGAPVRRQSGCDGGGGCCEKTVVELTSRALVEVSGQDAVDFLQGLITCDVSEITPDHPASHAMMLNVQGRVLYDLLVYAAPQQTAEEGPVFLLECAREVKDELLKLMKRYKIRKKVKMVDRSADLKVLAAVDGALTLTPDPGKVLVSVPDPRVPLFGQRLLISGSDLGIVTETQVKVAGEDHYHEKRYRWGIAEGTTDLPPGKALPLESNLVFTNGVSFTKGCYIGQELTARTHHTGVTRKRLMPLTFERPPEGVAPGETISTEQKSVGKLRGWVGVVGLGLMRVADMTGTLTLKPPSGTCPISLSAHVPVWWPSQQ